MEGKKERRSIREELAEKFIGILESDQPMSWTKGWKSGGIGLPYNGQSGRRYNGVNRFVLLFRAMEKNWTDPRYYTFHQVSQMEGCKVRGGEKAAAIEYWLLYDTKEKRSLTLEEYSQLLQTEPDRKEKEFHLYAKTAYVFNAAQIEGLQPLPQPERSPWNENRLAEEVMKTMSENIGVRLVYGGSEAYYSPGTDTIHLPMKEDFYSAEEYVGTCLHELAHVTATPSRLNRPLLAHYEDPDAYAVEELRAEMASAFVSAELSTEIPASVTENHMAYVSSWLSQIKQDHNVLFAAIKDADKIADYMLEMGRVEVLREKLAMEVQLPKDLRNTSYEIWQLKNTPENQVLLFSEYAYASVFRLTESRYEKVYEALAEKGDTLEQLYYKFNIHRPEDFKGHSLSVSDVIVLHHDGMKTAWYCDAVGFREIPGFCLQQTKRRGKTR